jgi:ATP-dependent DNA helicase RecG
VAGMDDALDRVLDAKSAALLAGQLDVHTVGELLRHYPRRYADQGQLTPIAGLAAGEDVTVVAEVRTCSSRRMQQKNGTIQQAVIFDGTRELNLTFFNQRFLPETLTPGRKALFAGRVSTYGKKRILQLTHPRFQLLDGDADKLAEFTRPLIPVYPATKDLPSWTIQLCVRQVFDVLDIPEDPLPRDLRARHRLLALGTALRAVHRSDDRAEIGAAYRRLKWDEAMAVQLTLARRRQQAARRPAPACPRRDGGLAAAFDVTLPFTLTAGQQEVGELLAAESDRVRPWWRCARCCRSSTRDGKRCCWRPPRCSPRNTPGPCEPCWVSTVGPVSWGQPRRPPGSRCSPGPYRPGPASRRCWMRPVVRPGSWSARMP